MLDHPHTRNIRFKVVTPPPLPVSDMFIGKPVGQVVEILPRLFNLCRVAQSVAIREALRLLVTEDDFEALRVEILTDHAQKLLVMYPRALGLAPMCAMPKRADDIRNCVFGGFTSLRTDRDFAAFLESGQGAAPVLQAIYANFGPGVAVTEEFPLSFRSSGAIENSAAARHQDHPVMRFLERVHGRGMLWRCFARLLDIERFSARAPNAERSADGWVRVPTARGAYFVRAEARDGVLTKLNRITPTDHMLVAGGIADRTLASVPTGKSDIAQLAITLLDPCSPVTLTQEVAHA